MFTSKKIKIWFTDMWANFDNHKNYFTHYLSNYFNIEINPKPDFLIHSILGKKYLKYNCYKICFTGENTRPDFTKSDYHIGFDYNDDSRYLRWPLFLMNRFIPELLLKQKDSSEILKRKKRFCSFVVSNDGPKERIQFFNELSKYKRVDSGGKVLNNIGGRVEDKNEFIKESKFNICFENVSYPGYTTEKLFEAFIANTIPIYWGNPMVNKDFNEKSFININNFSSFQDAIEYIKYIDQDDKEYKSIIDQNYFVNNELPEAFKIEKFISFFDSIFSQAKKNKPVYSFIHRIEYTSYNLRRSIASLKNN